MQSSLFGVVERWAIGAFERNAYSHTPLIKHDQRVLNSVSARLFLGHTGSSSKERFTSVRRGTSAIPGCLTGYWSFWFSCFGAFILRYPSEQPCFQFRLSFCDWLCNHVCLKEDKCTSVFAKFTRQNWEELRTLFEDFPTGSVVNWNVQDWKLTGMPEWNWPGERNRARAETGRMAQKRYSCSDR